MEAPVRSRSSDSWKEDSAQWQSVYGPRCDARRISISEPRIRTLDSLGNQSGGTADDFRLRLHRQVEKRCHAPSGSSANVGNSVQDRKRISSRSGPENSNLSHA